MMRNAWETSELNLEFEVTLRGAQIGPVIRYQTTLTPYALLRQMHEEINKYCSDLSSSRLDFFFKKIYHHSGLSSSVTAWLWCVKMNYIYKYRKGSWKLIKVEKLQGWRYGSAVTNTHYSSRGPRFDFQLAASYNPSSCVSDTLF